VIYSWIWSKLPGNNIVKSSISLALVAVVVFALFAWVFPAIDASFTESPVVSQ
jgi:hypothetical protein